MHLINYTLKNLVIAAKITRDIIRSLTVYCEAFLFNLEIKITFIKNVMRYILIILLFSSLTNCFSQDSTYVFHNKTHFDNVKTNDIRLGIGLNSAFYSEIGYAKHLSNIGDTGYFSRGYYVALEWLPKRTNFSDVYAIKVGYEVSALLLHIGIETKYQTDFDRTDFVVTPKIGVGLFSCVSLSYGYNISTNKSPFENVSENQFSLIFNIPVRKSIR